MKKYVIGVCTLMLLAGFGVYMAKGVNISRDELMEDMAIHIESRINHTIDEALNEADQKNAAK